METETAPWWMAGGLAAFWIVRETWGAVLARKKERTETDANVTLVEGLSKRIESLEAAQATLSTRINEEMALRMQAQEDAHKLRLRVLTLESTLRQLGAVIPPEPT
ncbi:MAG TPA: hypothetical protein VN017_01535 [Pseudoxanthomonas sp.]|nr:hypothetical protein [Pseudoxanthomonas sp.]